ncbi:MAG: hypothetical protein K2M98_01955 [Muribaculum sp.]|nr:hypothetical protein [Muribaculum sp.]
MDPWTSDFIITISVIIGSFIAKALPKKVKTIWKIVIALISAIILSMLGHIIVKLL